MMIACLENSEIRIKHLSIERNNNNNISKLSTLVWSIEETVVIAG
jgi:hypothetical protein